jgi:SAM-dependent methyltransferase
MVARGSLPPVLDACCGSRMFWFDKSDKRAIYLDKRRETHVLDVRPGRGPTVIDPDILGDFTNLPFPDETFWHVIFDPPHTITDSSAGWKRKKYGNLPCDGWREMLRGGFEECFRVLKPNGTLIFKWAESSVPLGEVLKLTDAKPLYGHKSAKQQQTHWVAFLKPNTRIAESPAE